MVLDLILNPDKTNEVYNIFKEENVSGADLATVIRTYTRDFNPSKEELIQIQNVLLVFNEAKAEASKKNMLKQHKIKSKEEERKSLEQLEKYNEIVRYRISKPGVSTMSIARELKISIDQFYKSVSKVEKLNPDLYQEYLDFKNKEPISNDELKAKINEVAYGIVFGIKDSEGNKKDFDIFDYYMVAQCEFDEFYAMAERIVNITECKVIKNFMNMNCTYVKHYNNHSNPERNVYFNREKKLDGRDVNIINGHKVTPEQNQQLFEIMDKYNMPDYQKLYSIGIKKVLNNEFENNSKKSL